MAKIRPVGPFIGCTPHTSYAIRLGIARRTKEIKIGSQVPIEPVLAPAGAASVMNPISAERASAIARSWFSKIAAVTALRW